MNDKLLSIFYFTCDPFPIVIWFKGECPIQKTLDKHIFSFMNPRNSHADLFLILCFNWTWDKFIFFNCQRYKYFLKNLMVMIWVNMYKVNSLSFQSYEISYSKKEKRKKNLCTCLHVRTIRSTNAYLYLFKGECPIIHISSSSEIMRTSLLAKYNNLS